MPISPWSYGENVESPNGDLVAIVNDAAEVGMGAPTSGTLEISNGIEVADCNPSIVWSEDSKYLAVPQWTKSRDQRLMVIDVVSKDKYLVPKKYRVLELHQFKNGVISGIDSPIHKSSVIKVNIRKFVETT